MSRTQEQFLNDVAAHEMHILHEDGIYRHIRFKKPGSSCMHFDLITYPGHLVYSGDMGCYVFSRLDDMFQFFRTDRKYQSGDGLKINLGYWSEKLQAIDSCGRSASGAKEFNEEKFNNAVIGDLVCWLRDNRDRTTKDERRELWDAVVSEVINAEGDGGGYRKQCAAHDFYHRVNDRISFQFDDFFEHDVTEYTHSFVWCCYALAWGIKKYDDAKGIAA